MNVLIACEESQRVCAEFRRLGHRAFSCDIQECSGGHPEWHIKGDVLPILNGNCTFVTMDKHTHTTGAVGSAYSTSSMHIPVTRCGKTPQLKLHTIGKDKRADNRED